MTTTTTTHTVTGPVALTTAVEIAEYIAAKLTRHLPGHTTPLDPEFPADHFAQGGYSDPEVQARYNLTRALASLKHLGVR